MGIDAQDACQWSTALTEQGNWAPLNLGVGYNPGDGLAYLSLMQNMPTTNTPLKYTVNITSADPDNYPLSGSCYYDGNGCYHGASGQSYSSDLGAGCTVSVTGPEVFLMLIILQVSIASGGTAIYVLGEA